MGDRPKRYTVLDPEADIDPLALQSFLETSPFDVGLQQIDLDVECAQRSREDLIAYGPTRIAARGMLQEAVLPKVSGTTGSTAPLVSLLKDMLVNVGVEEELIIVDGYFFPKQATADYIDVIDGVWDGVIEQIDKLVMVSLPGKTDANCVAEVTARAKQRNPSLAIEHHTSTEFHDRFWISKDRGLFVGTSVNGIGRRYALADYMHGDDVAEIRGALERLKILK